MEKWKRWLSGYARLRISGSRMERFLTLLKNKNIPIWQVESVTDGYEFCIQRSYIRELYAIRKKTGVHIKVIQKTGLPYVLFRYRKRKGLVFSFLLCMAMVYVCSLFIWNINVEGTYYYTEDQIKERLETQYVSFGQRKSEIDCKELEENLRKDFPEVSWISCEIIGTQLNVVIKETLDGTEIEAEDDSPKDIVAAKDGVIVEMITRSGTPLVKQGMTVSEGDTLISGVVYIYDDYDEVLETDYVSADGDIIAETVYQYEDSFDLIYYEKEYTGKTQKQFELQLFQKVLQLPILQKNIINYDEIYETHQLCIGKTYYLPISLTICERREYEPVRTVYSREEAIDRMNRRLDSYLEQLSEKEVEIMENHVTIEVDDDICTASGTVVVWENIGYGRPITVMESGEE